MLDILNYFLSLFLNPHNTIKQILQKRPYFGKIIIFLCLIGVLRGAIEGIWLLLMNQQFKQVFFSPLLFKNYLVEGIPFIFSNVTTAYVRWVGFAFVVYFFGRLLGGKGKFVDFLRLYGVILGIFAITILPNFIYLLLKFPIIRFGVSRLYNPVFGIGQLFTFLWLIFISYKVIRIVHQLPKLDSALISFLASLLSTISLILGALVFFNLPVFKTFSYRRVFSVATLVFIIFTLMAIPIFLLFGYKIERKKTKVIDN